MSTRDLAQSGPTLPRIRIGDWVESGVDWLNDNLGPFFDAVYSIVDTSVTGLSDALTTVPWPIMILIFAGLGWWLRSWKFAIFAVLGPLLIVSMNLWDAAMQTLALILVSGFVALVLAIPIGILAAQNSVVSRIVKPLLDLMQTMPGFVYLIPAVTLFHLGVVPGMVATVVFAMPPGVRLTELGIRQVDHEVVEAGEAFGASPMKVLARIKLPLALSTIMAGVNQVIMLALSMVVIAGMVSAPGLGVTVTGAVASIEVGAGFEGGLAVVILAIFLDRITDALGVRLGPARKTAARRSMLRRSRTTVAAPAPDQSTAVDVGT